MLGTVPLRHNWFRKASFVVACGLAVLALVRAGYGPPPSVTVGELDQYIEDKVEGIRDSMHDAVDDLHEWMDKEHSNFVPEVTPHEVAVSLEHQLAEAAENMEPLEALQDVAQTISEEADALEGFIEEEHDAFEPEVTAHEVALKLEEEIEEVAEEIAEEIEEIRDGAADDDEMATADGGGDAPVVVAAEVVAEVAAPAKAEATAEGGNGDGSDEGEAATAE